MKTKIALWVLVWLSLAAGPGPAPTANEDTLNEARLHGARAQKLLAAYNDDIILYRKTPPQTAEARSFRLTARAEAEQAIRRLDALLVDNVSLGAEDLALAGNCRLLSLDPDRPSTQTDDHQKNVLAAALDDFSAAWRQNPQLPAAYAGLLESDRLLGDQKAGEAVIAKTPAGVKKSPLYLLAAGRWYLDWNQPGQALPLLRELTQQKPDDADARLYLAAGLYMSGDAAGARAEAEKAFSLRASCETASLFLEHLDGMANVAAGRGPGPRGSYNLVDGGAAFEQRQDHGVSLFIYQQAVKAMPGTGRTLYMLGESQAYQAKLLGRKDEAVEAAKNLEKAMAAGGMPDVTRTAALVPLGVAYEAEGDYERAAATYREIVTTDPSYYRFYFDLARCLGILGRGQEAKAAWAKGEELSPKQKYTTGARRIWVEESIGTANDCGKAQELDGGEALIPGRVLVAGQGLAFGEVRMFLDDCSKMTRPAETDNEGKFKIALPPGNYIYNGFRVTHYPGLNESALGDMVYAPGKFDKLHEIKATSLGPVKQPNPPGYFTVIAGENPAAALEAVFAPLLRIMEPPDGAKILVPDAAKTELKWEKVPAAHHYLVDFYQKQIIQGNEALVPLREKILANQETIPLAGLFSAGLVPPAVGDYGVVVSAVDSNGQIVARSNGLWQLILE